MSYARNLIKLRVFQTTAADALSYANEATIGTNVKAALDWILAVLYPNTKENVNTPADLPTVGNTLNDYRVVLDDGDGKAASYRWEQREGESVPSWHKIHDMDWSTDSILSALYDQTQDLYAFRLGRMDHDTNGNPLTGLFEGQSIYGGTTSGNLTLNANRGSTSTLPEDQTGYIQFFGHARPTHDNSFDLGTTTERFRDIYVSRHLSDGTILLTIANLKAAYDHISVTSGNPHSVSYAELISKIGTITFNGDVSGSVDLSLEGAQTVTLTVADDSHAHTKATLTDFDKNVYLKVKQVLQDTSEVAWTYNDLTETAAPDVTIDTSGITDVAAPAVDKILVANALGDAWVTSDGLIDMNGDVVGQATYNSTLDQWALLSTIENTPLSTVDRINLGNKTFTSVAGNPTTLPISAHGLQIGEELRVFGTTFDGNYAVTVVDANTVTIAVSTAAAETGYYIPNGAQLLYNPALDMFEIRKEFAEIRLGELDGLNEDVLDIYVAKDGRSTGQTVHGGVSASENLILDSTTSATKGSIEAKSKITPNADAVYSAGWSGTDLGSSAKRWNDLYMAGQAKGLRLESVGSEPVSSGTFAGRLYNLSGKLLMDTGAAIKTFFSIPSLTGNAGKALVVNAGETDLELTQLNDTHIYLTANGINMTLEEAIVAGIIGNGLGNEATQVNGDCALANTVYSHLPPADAIGFIFQGKAANTGDIYFSFDGTNPDAANAIGHVTESTRDMGPYYVKKEVRTISTIAGSKYTLTWIRKV